MKDIFSGREYITGTEVNYYFICKTKLWLFSHRLEFEDEHENVKLGRLIHEESFKREKKNIRLGPVAFDFIKTGDKLEIHETKKSPKMKVSHRFQVLYYLYYLKKLGVDAEAVIHFPKQREKERLILRSQDREDLEAALVKMEKIKAMRHPPKPLKKRICTKCAYYEFCFS